MSKRCPAGTHLEKMRNQHHYCVGNWKKGMDEQYLMVEAMHPNSPNEKQHFSNFEDEKHADKLMRDLKLTGWKKIRKRYMKKVD